jgi:uncharacterized membrane protein YecN with MAPEG domain
MRSCDDLFVRKRWFDRSDILLAAACGTLAASLLLLLAPSIGTLFLEILAGLVMAARALVVRVRQRKAAQLRLELPTAAGRIRLPGRYELALIVVVTLSYRGISAMVRAVKISEDFIRLVPLGLFTVGLLAKNHILHALARKPKTDSRRRPDTVSMGNDL